MLTRIGHVFGWAGDILGALFIVGGLGNYFGAYEWLTSKFGTGLSAWPCLPVALHSFRSLRSVCTMSVKLHGGSLSVSYSAWLRRVAEGRHVQINYELATRYCSRRTRVGKRGDRTEQVWT